jgi:hypothetical protein
MLWLMLAPLSAFAEFQPNVLPELEVGRTAGEIEIDGHLDDPGWAGAARAVNWAETWPGDNVEPEIGHEAWIAYDDEALYVAWIVTEDPSRVRATLRDRDEIWRDDYVGLILDTYGSGAWAYELFVNPRGVQMDLRWTPNGEDMGFDVVWETEGRMTDTGWIVEARVPFRSLRFPDRDVQEWRATFWHNRPRESRLRYSWSASDRDDPCWPCQWGTLTGIEGVTGGGSLALLPSVTGYTIDGLDDPSDPASDFGHRDSEVEVGVSARYAISSSFAAEATLNPDFSQVESDAAQIDANTTFALFFPERRPFFQEGSDLFDSYVNAIYTRSINDPLWASKLTGRTERTSTALLVAQDETSPIILPFEERSSFIVGERSWSGIGRTRYSFGESSFAGGLGTFRALQGGGHNVVYGGDSMLRFWENFQFEGQVLVSHTEESTLGDPNGDLGGTFDGGRHTEALDGETFTGTAGYGSVEYHARNLDADFDYWWTSPTFRADNGFVTQNDNQRASLVVVPNWQPDNWLLDDASIFTMIARVWNSRGTRKDEWFRPELHLGFKSQTQLSMGYLWSNEVFGGEQLDGIERWDVHIESRPVQYFDFWANWEKGKFVARNADPPRLGDGKAFSTGINLQPVSRLSIEPSWYWQRLVDPATGGTDTEGFFEGWISRTRMNLQFTRKFFLRVIFQYNDFGEDYDLEPLLTYRINPFTVFYAGSAHRWTDFEDGFPDFGVEQTERQFFAKFQYLFHN